MKLCARCRKTKARVHFYSDKVKKDGLSSYCKECRRKHAQEWAQAHPEGRKRIMRAWQLRTDQRAHNRKVWVKRAYDKTLDEIERLRDKQHGACAVCGCPIPRYHIDHDHTTGALRGLLCRGCNLGLGFFQDSVKNLRSAIQYLEQAQ